MLYAPYADNKDLRASLERATIAPAGYVALNLAWNHALKQASPDRPNAVFMAGGMASGKTTASKNHIGSIMQRSGVIYDAVMHNFDNASRAIQQAIDAGLKPIVLFVFRPFEKAAEGAIRRLSKEGRPVGLAGFGPAHYNAEQVFLRITKAFESRADFMVLFNETDGPSYFPG